MAEAKVPYDRLEDSGDGAVYGSRIRVSLSNSDSIAEAISKLETGVSSTTLVTRRDFTGIPSAGDEQFILFGRGSLPGTGFRWNENTDRVEFSNDGLVWVDLLATGGSATKVEPVTVDSTILANKYYDLDLLPSSTENVRVFLIGGSVQYPNDDFELTVDGGSLLKRVSWNGKGLDTILVLGDKLLFVYETTEEISGISSGPITLKIDPLSISAGDITAQYKDLTEIPLDYEQVALFVAGGTVQIPNVDYTIIPDGVGDLKRIDLATLISNGDVVAGDTLVAMYNMGSGAGGAIRSEHIEVDTTTFTNNLSGLVAPATLQEALEEVDQFVFSGGGSGGEITKVQHFVTDGAGTVAGNQYVDLATTPADPETVRVTVVGGSTQLNSQLTPGSDFNVITDGVSLKRVSWNGLDMASALTGAGIYFIVEYTINTTNPDLAVNVQTDTITPFSGILAGATEVQAALNTLDDHGHVAADISDLTAAVNALIASAIPSGAVIIWTGASCPTGWTKDTIFDGVYIKGAATSPNLTPAGSNTHSHTVNSHDHSIGSHTHTFSTGTQATGQVRDGTGSGLGLQDSGPAPYSAQVEDVSSYLHTHTGTTDASSGTTGTASPGTNSASNEPVHIEVLFCKKD